MIIHEVLGEYEKKYKKPPVLSSKFKLLVLYKCLYYYDHNIDHNIKLINSVKGSEPRRLDPFPPLPHPVNHKVYIAHDELYVYF